MQIFNLDFYYRNIRTLGVIAIIVGVGAWALDLLGYVYVCPYCRAQRSVIAVLGIFMVMSQSKHFIILYMSCILGFFGTFVASSQHFSGWKKIQKGVFSWNDAWYLEPFMLSFFAICIITAQVLLLFVNKLKK